MGLKVTAFTTSAHKEAEIKKLGASAISSSIDLASLDKEKGKYDIVINTLFVEDEGVFKSHQRKTRTCGTYVQIGAPPTHINFKID